MEYSTLDGMVHSSAAHQRLELLLQLHGFGMSVLLVQGGKYSIMRNGFKATENFKKENISFTPRKEILNVVSVSLFRAWRCSLPYKSVFHKIKKIWFF